MKKTSYKDLEKEIKILKRNLKKMALRSKTEQYQELLYTAPLLFKIIEPVYNQKGALIDYYYRAVNKAFENKVGKTKKQLINNSYTQLFNEGGSHWLQNIQNALLSKGEHFELEYEASGNVYMVYAWDIEDNLLAITLSDVTEQKKRSVENKEARAIAEKYREIRTEFIGNLSHEIRTPMNGILGFTNFLKDSNLSDQKRDHYIDIIQNCGHQLLRVIDDLIEISKLETKKLSASKEAFSLNALLLELFTIFNIKAVENKIPLYLKRGLTEPDSYIISDKSKLNKILSNLLENALKFTSEGYIEFGYTNTDSKLEIYVKDTGIGIESNRHETIFDRFHKKNALNSVQNKGLGLGLHIAQQNTRLLRGEISLRSGLGIGTTFFVTIPYEPAPKEQLIINSNQTTKMSNAVPSCTVLIAEDEEINYLYLEIILKEKMLLNCNIIHAKNGQEAVNICNNNKIDLVFMDLKMPLIDGYLATKMIKKTHTNLPIIAHSASPTEYAKEAILKSGFDDYISKPINQSDFYQLIEKYNLTSYKLT